MNEEPRFDSANLKPDDSMNSALERQYLRLKDDSSKYLEAVVRDTSEPYAARAQALGMLLASQGVEPAELILELLDDAEPTLWQSAVRFYPYRCHDVRLVSRLKALLREPEETVWYAAAVALARSGDNALMPTWENWLGSEHRCRRRAAMSCLALLNTNESRGALQQSWDRDWDNEERLELASELLNTGDERGLPFLRALADSAQGAASAVAAMSIFCHNEFEGLAAMKRILEIGDGEAQQWTVDQISELVNGSERLSIKTIEEAFAWVQQHIGQRAS